MTVVVAAAIGAVVTMFVAWVARDVVGPWFVRPAIAHARKEIVDLVTVIVLSPEVVADLRPMFEEVVAQEVRVVIVEQASQGRRIERLEASVDDTRRMVRAAIDAATEDGPRAPGS